MPSRPRSPRRAAPAQRLTDRPCIAATAQDDRHDHPCRQRTRELGRLRGRPARTLRSRTSSTRSRAAGYDGTELGPYGYLPTDPSDAAAPSWRRARPRAWVRRSCRCRSRTRRGARRSVDAALARRPAARDARASRELIVADDEDPARAARAGRVPTDGSAGWTDAQWREAVATLNAVARALRDELGMTRGASTTTRAPSWRRRRRSTACWRRPTPRPS